MVAALVVAGCASPSVTPGATASRATAAATAATTPTAAATATALTSDVTVDPSLLGILPARVGGVAIVESREGEASAGQAMVLADVATGFAAGLAADPGGADWAFAVVVALEPGVMSDAVFRTWRDTYDEGACSQAGGVSGHAEAQLGGRTTYIASCAGGVTTYHVWLASKQRLVSVSAVGPRRFGEEVVKGIRE